MVFNKDDILSFLKTPRGMITVGVVAFVLVGGAMFLVGMINRGAVSHGYLFTQKPGQNVVDNNNADESFSAAWRNDLQERLKRAEKHNQVVNQQLAAMQADERQQTARSDEQMNQLLTEVRKLESRPQVVRQVMQQSPAPNSSAPAQSTGSAQSVAQAGSADASNSEVAELEKQAAGGASTSSQDNSNGQASAPIQVGGWQTIKVGGSMADLRKKELSDKAKVPSWINVPLGSFARATLLTGVEAPTEGLGTPLLFRIDTPFQGPNGQTYPATGCFAIGEAKGQLGTVKDAVLPNGQKGQVGRVQIHMIGMSCDWGSSAFDQKIVGYAEDMDKNFGIQGIVHDRSLKYMQQMALSQGISGLGQSLYNAANQVSTISNSSTTITRQQLTGSILSPAAGSFLQGYAQQYAKYWANKAKKATTTITIPGGVPVDFYVVSSFKIRNPASGRTGDGIYGKNGMY